MTSALSCIARGAAVAAAALSLAVSAPAADAPLLGDGRLGYWFRAGEHSMTPQDWKVYMDFADRQWK